VLITKNGRVVAQMRPRPTDSMDDPAWRAAYEALMASLRTAPRACNYPHFSHWINALLPLLKVVSFCAEPF
jgi:hypothetical protein